MPDLRRTILAFKDLKGWAADDHSAALAVFQTSFHCLPENWRAALSSVTTDARTYFETSFVPVVFEDEDPALFTGYFEPELDARLTRTTGFAGPIYTVPDGWSETKPWLSRSEIEKGNALKGREIAWLRDPVEAFFLQVQGSGRLRLPGGKSLRVGYAGKNGFPYVSIGKELVRRGICPADQMTADVLRDWIRANPKAGVELMRLNPSFVFFKTLDLDPNLGPLGAAGVPVVAGRSIAVDPGLVPYGAPFWVEKCAPEPINRLMIAQDTGSAIRGAQRADIFVGTGDAAGTIAGRIRETGRMVSLVPKALI